MRCLRKGTPQLYCFADSLEQCRALLAGGARVIQYRDKTVDDSTFLKTALLMREAVHAYPDGVFIVNDRVELAVRAKADGIHLGQDDGKVSDILRRIPDSMWVGVSVDTPAEARAAAASGASYIGAGALFPTSSKKDAVLIGPDTARQVIEAVRVPVAVIGGINLDRLPQVLAIRPDYICVIADINHHPDPGVRIQQYQDAIAQSIEQGVPL